MLLVDFSKFAKKTYTIVFIGEVTVIAAKSSLISQRLSSGVREVIGFSIETSITDFVFGVFVTICNFRRIGSPNDSRKHELPQSYSRLDHRYHRTYTYQ